MKRRLALMLIPLLALIACAGRNSYHMDPESLPLTGSVQTKEWQEFNARSQTDNQPRLTYAVLCADITDGNPRNIVSGFDPSESMAYLYAKWDNVDTGSKYRIEWYDPRGILYDTGEMSYGYSSRQWNTWGYIYVRSVATRLPGIWKVKLYMNDRLALAKEVPVGDPANQLVAGKPVQRRTSAIAFRSLLAEGIAGPKYSGRVPDILSQRFVIDHPEYMVLPTQKVNTALPLAKGISKSMLQKELAGSPFIKDLLLDHKVKLLVTGYANGEWTIGDINQIEVYLLDTHTGETKMISVRYTLPPIKAGKSFDQWMVKVSGDIYEKMMAEHGDFVLTALGR